jgi:signal recognition particle subunit SRP54
MLKGDFGFDDFLNQIRSIKKMGPLQDLMEKLPFFPGGIPAQAKVDDYELVRIESIINSMTPKERKTPDLISDSRISRIAKGSGRKESEVKELLGKFKDMRDLMSAMGGGKLRGRWKGLKGIKKMLSGGMPDLGMPESPVGGMNPFGMPEAKKGKITTKKTLEKQRKKNKLAKQARKKGKKK